MLKSILANALSLGCLFMLAAGTSEAKGPGGGGRGGGSRGGSNRGGHVAHPHPGNAHHKNPHHKPPHHKPPHKHPPKHDHDHHHHHHNHHHHGHGGGGGIDIDIDGGGFDGFSAGGYGYDLDDADDVIPVARAVYGVEITALYKGTAAKEGLEIGDVILSFNGTPTPDFETLSRAVARSGSTAEVVVIRDDDGKRETVTLRPVNGQIGVSGERVRVDD